MKRLLSALALAGAFLLVPTMRAQSTTITASNIADVGAPVTGTWCVQPTQQFVRAGGGNVVPNQVCYSVTAGVLQSGVSLPDSSLTNPVNICYRVTILNTYQERVAQYPCFQPSGTTYSFDNFVQAAPPYIPTSFTLPQFLTNGVPNTIQNRINFAGTGVSYSNGTLTFTGGGGGSMTWPAAAGISVYAGGSLWGTSLTAPAGPLVGTTDTQTLTNKTLDGVTPATMGYVDPSSSIQTQLNAKQSSLGFTPLNAASNLSDVVSAATARTNLGLGSAAIAAGPTGTIVGTTDTQTLTNKTLDGVTPATMGYVDPTSSIQTQLNAKQASLGFTPLNAANNLSDVASAATALTNLGAQQALGYTAVPNTRTVNGHALSANVIVSATDITTGTLPHAQLPAFLSGDIPNNGASTTGQAATAVALATTPTLCSTGLAPTGILANGNATGCATIGSGGSMTWPGAAGIAVYAGGNVWGTSLAAPTGTIVGTTDTQTLTNKTLDGVTAATMGYVDPTSSIQTQLNGKQSSLGFTPLNAANNLSDVAVAATARTNLGLGTAAIAAGPTGAIVGTTDTQTLTNKTLDGVTPTTMGYVDPTSSIQTQLNAKQASLGFTPLNAASNLSDVAVAATARTNLGLGSAATAAGPTGAIVGTTDTQTLTNKTLDGVTPTTMGYVDPTSSIQTQLNGKQASLGYTAAHAGANGDITSLTGITTALTVAQGGTGVGAGTGYEYGNGTAAHTFSTTIPYSAISSPPTLAATLAKVSHQWLDSYTSSTGLFTQSQPAFSDLSGSATAAQIPTALSSTTSVNGTTIPASGTLMQTSTAVLASQMPALTGDCTTTAGAVATTCTKTNGVALGSLATLSAVPVSPLTISASAGPVTVSGNTGYWFNNFGAMTYNLPTITSGLVGAQYCFRNYTAITGVITIQLPASTYVDRNGAIGTVAGHLASAGALGDSACVVAISTTRYVAYIQSGTWVNP